MLFDVQNAVIDWDLGLLRCDKDSGILSCAAFIYVYLKRTWFEIAIHIVGCRKDGWGSSDTPSRFTSCHTPSPARLMDFLQWSSCLLKPALDLVALSSHTRVYIVRLHDVRG